MPLVINALRGGHTHTHTHILMHKQKQFQETRQAPACGQHTNGLKIDFIDMDDFVTAIFHFIYHQEI